MTKQQTIWQQILVKVSTFTGSVGTHISHPPEYRVLKIGIPRSENANSML